MSSSLAWQSHGCYKLGSEQYFNMPLENALIGCEDDWNSLDHFDPTAPLRRQMAHFHYLRTQYPSLQDGFNLVLRGNWTYYIQRPGSASTQTEMGFWSVTRSALPSQNLTGAAQIWLLYTNENKTTHWEYDCMGPLWIPSPFESGVRVKNLFFPYEEITTALSGESYNRNGQAPYTGCLPALDMDPFGYKAYVPIDTWVPPIPQLTKFEPGHDARIQAEENDAKKNEINIAFEFSQKMNCNAITTGLLLNVSSSGLSSMKPNVKQGSVQCNDIATPLASNIPGVATSVWRWSGVLENVPDGVLRLTLTNIPADGSTTVNTGVSFLYFFC